MDHFDAQVSKRDILASIAYLSFVYNTWNTRYDSGYPLVITSSLLKVRPLSLIRIVLVMDFGIASVTAITVICYLIGMICKSSDKVKDEMIPSVCGVCGAVLGIAGMYVIPDFPAQDMLNAIAIGIVSGFASTGLNQAVKQLGKAQNK